METNKILSEYYSNYDEDGRLEKRHGLIEFLTTMHYIEKYLKPGDRILEVGAATGRYSHTLARMGYAVDAVELVEYHIKIFKQNTKPGENVTITQGNALDLSDFADNTYDLTLVLGPMYHLYNQEDKRQAISEAIRVTKQDGIIVVAYVISDSCVLFDGFINERFSIEDYLKNGMIDSVTWATTSKPKDLFELVRKEDVDELMSVFPVTRLHYVATGNCVRYTEYCREVLDSMSDERFNLFMQYHFATCEREDLLGITSHTIDVFRKNK